MQRLKGHVLAFSQNIIANEKENRKKRTIVILILKTWNICKAADYVVIKVCFKTNSETHYKQQQKNKKTNPIHDWMYCSANSSEFNFQNNFK